MRAGIYVKQATGYQAFIPAPLPPDPSIEIDAELGRLMSEADRALGRLDGVATVLPNPDLFVSMYVRQEAVLSSQIEGTQSNLEDVLQFEVDSKGREFPKDIQEVVNYVRAMNYGLERLKTLPLSLRLIREIHGKLLEGVRGSHRTPGSFAPLRTGLARRDAHSILQHSCLLLSTKCVRRWTIRRSFFTTTHSRCSSNAALLTRSLKPSIRFLTAMAESDVSLSLFFFATDRR